MKNALIIILVVLLLAAAAVVGFLLAANQTGSSGADSGVTPPAGTSGTPGALGTAGGAAPTSGGGGAGGAGHGSAGGTGGNASGGAGATATTGGASGGATAGQARRPGEGRQRRPARKTRGGAVPAPPPRPATPLPTFLAGAGWKVGDRTVTFEEGGRLSLPDGSNGAWSMEGNQMVIYPNSGESITATIEGESLMIDGSPVERE